MKIMLRDVDRFDLELCGDGSLAVSFEGRIRISTGEGETIVPSLAEAFGFTDKSAAGRHGNHRRWNQVDPDCPACIAGDRGDDRGAIAGDRGDVAEAAAERGSRAIAGDRGTLQSIEVSTRDLDPPPSDSLLPAGVELIDLDRPDVAALRARWSRGGKKKAALSHADLALLDQIARDPRTGVDEAAGREWSAAVISQAKRGSDLVGRLRRTFDELALPAAPPPPDPTVLAEATAERRAEIIRDYQELVASGEASDVVKAELAKLEARYGAPPAQSH